MNEAVKLIRELTETLARAEQEIVIPGSIQRMGFGDIREQIDSALDKANEFLNTKNDEDDEAAARALAELIGDLDR